MFHFPKLQQLSKFIKDNKIKKVDQKFNFKIFDSI